MESAAPGLLVVDDEADLRELIGEYFSRQGCTSRPWPTPPRRAKHSAPGRPRSPSSTCTCPARTACRSPAGSAKHHPATGVVMLTTAAETIDRIVGLEVGADDYVPKPFDLRELHRASRALLRRLADVQADPAPRRHRPARDRVRFGERWLDLGERRLFDRSARRFRSRRPNSSCWRCSRATRTGR